MCNSISQFNLITIKPFWTNLSYKAAKCIKNKKNVKKKKVNFLINNFYHSVRDY